jgi:thiosulfate/3-mercaptopyruvate sulfurtransferase
MPSRNFRTTAELAAELGDPNLGVIDASWHLPNTARIGAAEFRLKHIPGAVFFDIDAIADLDQGLPHMLPKPETLAMAASIANVKRSVISHGDDRARPGRRHALRRL